MIDIKYLRDNPDLVQKNSRNRKSAVDIKSLVKVDEQYLSLLKEVEDLRGQRNLVAAKAQAAEDRQASIEQGKQIKVAIASKETELKDLELKRNALLHAVPNQTHPDVPIGEGDADNKVLKEVGKPRKIKNPKNHLELAEQHDLIDFERATKVAGAKFYFLKNKLALLEQALIRYGIDFMAKEGYEVLVTPDVSKEEVLVAKGFLPRGPENQVYFVEGQDLALIGTSEIPVLGYHMGETLPEAEIPKKYVAFSHCFRTEAGSYGRESYGLYRVHQFSKVEMFAFCKPDQSEALHLEFLENEKRFWKSLGIPFRVVDCATGDLGGSDYRRYDIEAWMWGKNEGKGGWGEVTSCSNCIDYQARGLNIKYATKEGDKGFVHTLNGTVVATPRAMIAILENYQQADGTISIPEVLIPYCGFDQIG